MIRHRSGARFALAASLLVADGARGEAVPVPTSRTTVARVTSRARGLDRLMPRDGAYQRALEAVVGRRYREAVELFGAAENELYRAGQRGLLPAATSRSLMFKAAFEQGQALLLVDRDGGRRVGRDNLFLQAVALHNLYLASSAYFDRVDEVLLERALAAYRHLLAAEPEEKRVRVALATLYAASGQRGAAVAEMARVDLSAHGPELLDFLAHYYASVGDRDRAFAALRDLRDIHPDWGELRAILRVINDLDGLRDDPRFSLLLGDDE